MLSQRRLLTCLQNLNNMEKLSFEQVQATALEVLKRLTDICEAHNFTYVLCWGTLIGAIRHKGFIPWDDDIDIMMPRPDFDKFLDYCDNHKDELKPYEILNMDRRKDYPNMLTRVCDSRTWLDCENEKDCGMGVFVDIYPMDGIGETYEEAWNLMSKVGPNNSLIFLASRQHFIWGTTKGWKKKLLKIPAYLYAKLMGQQYFVRKTKQIVEKLDYDKSNYVCCASALTHPDEIIFKKEIFNNPIKVPFEKYQFYIPANYDEVLKETYGDYMKLPPEKDRIHHHFYTAYKK